MPGASSGGLGAALYLRVSSEEQTVENQRPELEQLARARGLKVVATYEENVSAVKARPAFARMLEDAHRGRFDVLVIWAIDRFGRSMAGNIDDVMKLDARGVKLISARESWLEMDGPARSLLVGVFSWVAEQERRRLSERTIAGMERARASGLHVGRPRARVSLFEHDCLRDELRAKGKPATSKVLARRLGVSPSTLDRALRARREKHLADLRTERRQPVKRGTEPKGAEVGEIGARLEPSQKGPLST